MPVHRRRCVTSKGGAKTVNGQLGNYPRFATPLCDLVAKVSQRPLLAERSCHQGRSGSGVGHPAMRREEFFSATIVFILNCQMKLRRLVKRRSTQRWARQMFRRRRAIEVLLDDAIYAFKDLQMGRVFTEAEFRGRLARRRSFPLQYSTHLRCFVTVRRTQRVLPVQYHRRRTLPSMSLRL